MGLMATLMTLAVILDVLGSLNIPDELPAVTNADNGKVLTVAGGIVVWSTASHPSLPTGLHDGFIKFTATGQTYSIVQPRELADPNGSE